MPAVTKYSEEDFVRILSTGQSADFGIIYDHFSGALFGVITKIIENRDVAEDVLQEAFVKIWNNRHSYDTSKGRIYTWMLNIARNSAIDAARNKHIKVASKIRNVEDSVNTINKRSNTSQQEDTIGITQMVEALLPEQKVILDMMYFGGMTQEEIGNELKIPLGTVKTRTRAALQKLRDTFKHGLK